MKPKSILFVVNGLGLGNSTRSYAVIQELLRKGHVVDVSTSGNGLRFFSAHPGVRCLVPLLQSTYQSHEQRIGFASLIRAMMKFPFNGIQNTLSLVRHVRRWNPDLIVVDSNYNLGLRCFTRVKMISLNNSCEIVRECFNHPTAVWNNPAQFIVELVDSLYQRLIPDIVIVPWPRKSETKSSGIVQVEPIVRESFFPGEPFPKDIKKVLILYSGSGLSVAVHEELQKLGYQVSVFGELRESFNCAEALRSADVAVVSGGFSSISEALACQRPMIVIPIPGHAEQFINARGIEKMRLGFIGVPGNLRESIKKLESSLPSIQNAYRELEFSCRGRLEAAEIIERTLQEE